MNKKLLIVANSTSILTNKLVSLIGNYFQDIEIVDNRTFSIHSPIKLFKSIVRAKKTLRAFAPSFIILYQIDVAAFFVAMLNKNTPMLAVGIGSDILTIPNKSFLNRFLVSWVLKRCKYFNAGSVAIKEKMQSLSKKPIDVFIANLGTDDILPKEKQNIIFSNRLHKDLYNIDKVISAFARFVRSDTRKDWTLIIAATGKEDEFARQVKDLGLEDNVKFVGWLDKEQNAYYYSISKIWVSLPSSDSISLSLLEAMSAGCIPVCYDVEALEGFLYNNKNAVIVKDWNENFFERALLLDKNDIIVSNRNQARKFADKDVNREKFYTIFNKASPNK